MIKDDIKSLSKHIKIPYVHKCTYCQKLKEDLVSHLSKQGCFPPKMKSEFHPQRWMMRIEPQKLSSGLLLHVHCGMQITSSSICTYMCRSIPSNNSSNSFNSFNEKKIIRIVIGKRRPIVSEKKKMNICILLMVI